MTSSLGLPRYVVMFLRHMESHKDYLKWNISESSHKITLTLTWNFRRSKPGSLSDSLLDKLQRTLNIGRSPTESDGHCVIPHDLTKFLEETPKKHKKTRLKRRLSLTVGAIRRTLSTSSSHQTPLNRHDSINRSSSFNALPSHHSNHVSKLTRHNSFHAYNSGTRSVSPVKKTTTALRDSPFKSPYSWGGGSHSFNISGRSNSQSADELDIGSSQLDGATASSCCSSDRIFSPQKPRRLKLTYRSEDELEESLEDIMEKTRSETQAKLECIRKEWNETIREWPRIITAESMGGCYSNPPPSLSSTFIGASGGGDDGSGGGHRSLASLDVGSGVIGHRSLASIDTGSGVIGHRSLASIDTPPLSESTDNIHKLQGETIGKCLDSCEKILTRYETDIT